MLAEVRDSLFTVAWFGLMTSVWLGWAQESPVARLRVPLVVGAGTGIALAVGFGVLTGLHWSDPTALEGRYAIFGVVVAAEVVLAGAGASALVSTGRARWTAWRVALVVAVHFVGLAWVFRGPSLAVLGAAEVVALAVGVRVARGITAPSSRWVGPAGCFDPWLRPDQRSSRASAPAERLNASTRPTTVAAGWRRRCVEDPRALPARDRAAASNPRLHRRL